MAFNPAIVSESWSWPAIRAWVGGAAALIGLVYMMPQN